jgi:hypothetical protein
MLGAGWIVARSACGIVGDGFYASSQDAFEIGHYSSDGQLLRSVRRRWEPVAVTAAEIAELREGMLAREASQPAMMLGMAEAVLANMQYPDAHPAHGWMLVDRNYHLWVLETPSDEEAGRVWSVFDPEGHFLGSVPTPPRLRVTEIGADYVLGVRLDDLDVPQVRLHRLVKP